MNKKTSKQTDEQTNDPHDIRLKELFNNKDAFISLLKDSIKPEWIQDLDTDSLQITNHSFILQDFSKKEADIVYEGTLKNGKEKVIFYMLLEIQRKVDYRMPYRLLLYIVEILRFYYNNADEKDREQAEFKFPAVFPIVFFNGNRRWTPALNLRKMFYGNEYFGKYLIDFDYVLVDVKGYDDESVKDFHSKLLKVMIMLEKAKNSAELCEVLERYVSDIISFSTEEIRILGVAIEIFVKLYGQGASKEIIEKFKEVQNAKGVNGMLSDIVAGQKKYEKKIRDEAAKEAAEKATKKIKIETAKILLEMGLTIEQVAKGSQLPISQIEKLKETQ